jgi:pyruvate dehydrogenase E2 component (dihydrolipoamide acetyltransferase)
MSQDLTLPDLGEGIETATVVEIFVKPGDTIAGEQALMSLETDKAQFELPSTMAGTVEEVLVSVGDDVAIGQAVLKIAGGGDAKSRAATTEPAADTAAEDTEADAKPPARREPRERATEPSPEDTGKTPAPPTGQARGPVAAAPSVRRRARELGVRLADVATHTGSDRLTSADVEAFKRDGGTRPAAPAHATAPGWPMPAPLPDFSKWGEIEIEEMTKIRRKTAENMARAWIEIPTVTHNDEADITKLERLRKKYAPRVKEAGGHLTWTAILLNVLAGALKRFPQFNASVDMAEHRIIYKKYVHIGVAVDTERGLLVPVIRDVDEKNVVELAKALAEISEAARGRNIKPEMMQGATFTITNLGGIGGVAFSPIVNPPQVAILGVSRGSTRPVWREERFEPHQILPLALSYDHRVIDGADAARFLRWVCEALEEPFLLDLEGQ